MDGGEGLKRAKDRVVKAWIGDWERRGLRERELEAVDSNAKHTAEVRTANAE